MGEPLNMNNLSIQFVYELNAWMTSKLSKEC